MTYCPPVQILYNHETLVTIPEGPPKGVLFVLAACDTFVLVWAFPSHGCKHCVGTLPQPESPSQSTTVTFT